jgi:hypothetical protein
MRRKRRNKEKDTMRTMYSKFPGSCRDCGKAIAKGTLIKYFGRGQGVAHFECNPISEHKAPCWKCGDPNGKFRNLGAATPVWCDACFAIEDPMTFAGKMRRKDNSSAEDACCGDLAYEDACARACGF